MFPRWTRSLHRHLSQSALDSRITSSGDFYCSSKIYYAREREFTEMLRKGKKSNRGDGSEEKEKDEVTEEGRVCRLERRWKVGQRGACGYRGAATIYRASLGLRQVVNCLSCRRWWMCCRKYMQTQGGKTRTYMQRNSTSKNRGWERLTGMRRASTIQIWLLVYVSER